MTEAIPNRRRDRINEWFPHKVCINLDRRPDRWSRMQDKFAQAGIDSVRRFPAVDGNEVSIPKGWLHSRGAFGCLQSHLLAVREARQANLSHLLIFEDDVVFDNQLHEKFGNYVKQVPADWDMLFLGALHKDEPVPIFENIARVSKANSTYAYALKDTIFDDFIELNSQAGDVLDNNNFVLQQRYNCYCFMPHLAWVETGYSDAQNRLEHHWYLQQSLILFGREVDRLLKDTTIVFAYAGQGARAQANLMFLVSYYDEYFSPFLDIVVVEQRTEPTVDQTMLPPNCKYVLLRETGPFNRARCFNIGMNHCDPNRNQVILSDADIFLETLDIRANLRMCEEYDWVTGFSRIIDLNDEDSRHLLRTRLTRGIDISATVLRNSGTDKGYYCFVNRDLIQRLGGFDEDDPDSLDRLLSSPKSARVFPSPNYALRLAND